MLENVKLLLGIDPDDTSLDEKLILIITMVTARLKTLLGGVDPPETMDHIITEVSVIRFNRIGSEGLSSHTVEGEAQSFALGDFDAYKDEILAFLASQEDGAKGKLVFL